MNVRVKCWTMKKGSQVGKLKVLSPRFSGKEKSLRPWVWGGRKGRVIHSFGTICSETCNSHTIQENYPAVTDERPHM